MSEPTTATAEPATEPQTADTFTPPATQADLDRIIAERVKRVEKKYEGHNDLKAKAAKLDELTASQQTELERAVAQAREEAKAEGRKEAAQTVAAARLEAALTGLVPDPQAIVEDLNLAKFVTDDGGIDDDAVAALKAKYAATTSTTAPGPRPDLSQGAQPAVALNDDALLKTITNVLST